MSVVGEHGLQAAGIGGEFPSEVGMFDVARCGLMAVEGAWGLGWCLGHV